MTIGELENAAEKITDHPDKPGFRLLHPPVLVISQSTGHTYHVSEYNHEGKIRLQEMNHLRPASMFDLVQVTDFKKK